MDCTFVHKFVLPDGKTTIKTVGRNFISFHPGEHVTIKRYDLTGKPYVQTFTISRRHHFIDSQHDEVANITEEFILSEM